MEEMSDMWLEKKKGRQSKTVKVETKKIETPKKIVVAVTFTFACLYYAETKSTKESSVSFKSRV
jgi:hypothetical protein